MVKLNTSIHLNFSEIVIENLRRRNVITIVDFIATDPVKLTTFTGLSHMDILQMKKDILKKFGGTKKNANELLIIELNNIMSTSIRCLDELLKGGLYPGQLCEICGLSASGKTQLCFTIATNAVAKLNIVTWYLDTKRDFSRLRFEEILRARNFTQTIIENALQRIKVCHIRSARQMIQALRHLVNLCKTEQDFGKEGLLIIIDSLPAIIFKVTRDMCHNDLETTYELDDLAQMSQILTKECQAIVITVNSVTRWDSTKQDDLNILTPALGKHWARIPVTRLLLIREHNETRKITVWKDSRLKENSSCIVNIGDVGITMQ
ncbi:hypothetical protein HN011_001527 [Eciton burchellii]|nr:hypothetical protein HN011_001527 [Eciton burchellii]